MHEREFEKQVQQKMQELKFQPGADVWARVQADMQKKRRRRPVLLWMLLAGLMIGSAWILYTTVGNNDNTQQAAAPVPSSETNEPATRKDNNTTAEPKTNAPDPAKATSPVVTKTDKTPDQNVVTSTADNKPENNLPKVITPAEKRSIAQKVNTKHQQANEKPAGHDKSGRQPVEPSRNDVVKSQLSTKVSHDPDKTDNVKMDIAKSDVVKTDNVKSDNTNKDINVSRPKSNVAQPDNAKSDNAKSDNVKSDNTKSDVAKSGNAKTDIAKPDNVRPDIAKSDNAAPVTTAVDSSNTAKPNDAQPDIAKSDASKTDNSTPENSTKDSAASLTSNKKSSGKNKNIQWGFTAGAGISDLGTELFQATSVADFAFGNGSLNTPSTSTVRRPSTVSSGLAFHLGAFASKSIGKKLRFKLGLQYEYFSNAIRTGAFVDSLMSVNQGRNLNVVDEYYKSGSTNKYTNGYHFLSMPVSLQWRINRHPKYGIVWENGFSFSQLLHSNALHYDGISGTYYQDKNMFRKTQFTLSSSLLFHIKTKEAREIYIGPQVQYGVTSLIKADAYNNKHLRYAGVKLMMGFNKN